MDRAGVLIARVLVDATPTIPVQIVFPSGKRELKRGTVIGTLCAAEFGSEDKVTADTGAERVGRCAAESDEEFLRQFGWEELKHLTPIQRVEAQALLLEYRELFSRGAGDVGRTRVTTHAIPTGNARPVRRPPRRLPQVMRSEVDRQVDEMLERGIVRPSMSPWSAPVVLVRKKEGRFRFCVDYRGLNDLTIRDSYPLPRIDETLESLGGAKYFTTLDLASGYWQVEMEPRDAQKTAFSTGRGQYEFTVMPFGLCNAPATFQRLMEYVLAGLQYEQCLIYLDDVIVFGSDFGEHLERLRNVLERFKDAGLKLQPATESAEEDRLEALIGAVGLEPAWTAEELAELQWQDPLLQKVREVFPVKPDAKGEWRTNASLRVYRKVWHQLAVQDNVLYRFCGRAEQAQEEDGVHLQSKTRKLLVLPDVLVRELLTSLST
eukprot:m.284268 g.284268  ORF g.284268 m.284268 type:complete len:434 (+) comp40678_c0_seq9:2291-3592(+)